MLLIAPEMELCEETLELFVSGEVVKPEVRLLSQLKSVLMKPEELREDGVAYLIYRDLPPLRGSWARFDLTVVLNWEVGGELSKTKGHYHLPLGGKSLPEIYYIHLGEAAFLLQKKGSSIFEIEDFVIVRAREGSFVRIPRDYGHVTVNLRDDLLVMSNVIHRKVEPDYESYEATRGAAYYITREGIVRNPNYISVPEPRYEGAESVGESIQKLLGDENFLNQLRS